MTLPHPGAPHMDNLIATLLLAGNGSHELNLDRIAHHQRFDPEEFRSRFKKLETNFSLRPRNSFEEYGK
jgi:hypothetical protein